VAYPLPDPIVESHESAQRNFDALAQFASQVLTTSTKIGVVDPGGGAFSTGLNASTGPAGAWVTTVNVGGAQFAAVKGANHWVEVSFTGFSNVAATPGVVFNVRVVPLGAGTGAASGSTQFTFNEASHRTLPTVWMALTFAGKHIATDSDNYQIQVQAATTTARVNTDDVMNWRVLRTYPGRDDL
jgi:hypothetical protein